ncbi:DUF3703 domain-containing protein [Sphingomonas sp. NPDC092331]|jgi:Protein of unknown function (DUF3703)|uniref:DUF3703 domain-containing protein n=1 Tax=unclassified Sphingomonas TaxID=196159 RepID=UPI0031F58312
MPAVREPWIPALVEAELTVFRDARAGGDAARAWRALERAHILAQPRLVPHLRVHAIMLGYAWRLRQPGEVAGQLFRMALAPLGHLTGRTPAGNTGRSNVSAFAPMPIPSDLHSAREDARDTPR